VSQADLVLFLAFAFSLVGTAALSFTASLNTRAARSFHIASLSAAVIAGTYAITATKLRFNFTPSLPLGIYQVIPMPMTGFRRGMMVAVCAPVGAAQFGHGRGYLSNGACTDGTEPLLKIVAAVAGDAITICARGIIVNGRLLPQSKAVLSDLAGRPLSPWPSGQSRVRRGQIWLYADAQRSWDSRYWGPVPVRNILVRLVPLFTFPALPPWKSGARRTVSGILWRTKMRTHELDSMRALSVRPPWAWAIAHADKRTENRTWTTSYRGGSANGNRVRRLAVIAGRDRLGSWVNLGAAGSAPAA
jgi:conjugative transfer signal peptidase TraF